MDSNTINFINAGFAGMISRTATAPLERIKVMYQNKSNIKTSQSISVIFKQSCFTFRSVNISPFLRPSNQLSTSISI